MATRQQKFYNEVYAGARQAGLSDARARLAAAQASLETGYGKSMAGGNMFGIKAGKSWTGPTQDVKTWEDVGGRVNIVDKFRSYANPFDSLTDWVGLTDRRFPAAAAAQTFNDAAAGLRAGQPGGYATDRKYASKLKQIDKNFGLAAQQEYGVLGKDLPVPSAAPRGVMDALGSSPSEVAAYEDRGFRNAQFPATEAPVQRGLLADISPAAPAFDIERFGPAPSTENFDTARFGGTSPNVSYDSMVAQARAAQSPSMLAGTFDNSRFGSATTQPQGVDGLRQGLLASNEQLSAPRGVLNTAQAAPAPQASPMGLLADQYSQYGMGQAAMQQAVAPSTQAANLAADVADQRAKMGLAPALQPDQPGYVDPMVSTQQPAVQQPTVQAPMAAAPAAAINPGAPAPMAGDFGSSMTPEQAKSMERKFQAYRLGGGVLGGVLGGALLGPVGGLLGGYLGRNMGAKAYYPTAPQAVSGGNNQRISRDTLNDRGRDTYEKSKQFREAVNKGSAGLY